MSNPREIVVDSEDIRKKGKRFLEISEIFMKMGTRINNQCLSVPSYDGQLGKLARDVGTHVKYECNAQKIAFNGMGEYLIRVADQFEKVDNDSIEAWSKKFTEGITFFVNFWKYVLLGIQPMEGDNTNGYKDCLAYFKINNGRITQIWYGGQCICFDITDSSLSEDEKNALSQKLTSFKEQMQLVYQKLDSYCGSNRNIFWAVLVIVGSAGAATPIAASDIIAALSGFGISTAEFSDLEEKLNEVIDAFNKAAKIWQELNSSDVPGKIPCP